MKISIQSIVPRLSLKNEFDNKYNKDKINLNINSFVHYNNELSFKSNNVNIEEMKPFLTELQKRLIQITDHQFIRLHLLAQLDPQLCGENIAVKELSELAPEIIPAKIAAIINPNEIPPETITPLHRPTKYLPMSSPNNHIDPVAVFTNNITYFREVEPDLIYAGGRITNQRLIKELAKQRFKYVVDVDPLSDNSDYRKLLEQVGIKYVEFDDFESTIKNASTNNERIYLHCNYGFKRSKSFELAYQVVFNKKLPRISKEVRQNLGDDGIDMTMEIIGEFNDTKSIYTREQLKKIETYLTYPDELTKDLNLDVDI